MSTEQFTGDQVRSAMIANNITEVPHHDCGICGEWTAFVRSDDQLYYRSACECSWSPPLWCLWSDAADFINMQTNPKCRADIVASFGLQGDSQEEKS